MNFSSAKACFRHRPRMLHLLLSTAKALHFFHSHPLIQHSVSTRNEGLFGQNEYFEDDQSDSSCHWIEVHVDSGRVRNMKHGKKATNRGPISKHLQGASSESFDEDLTAKFVNKI